jgi:hypothetical protein
MSTPIPGRPPSASPPASRRPRPLLLIVAALLVVAAVGSGVALASRTSPRPAVATAHAVDTGTAAHDQPAAQAPAGQTAGQRTKPAVRPKPEESGQAGGGAEPKDRGPRSADTAKGAAVLPDGVHHALIRKVDVANDRITVDVVQLFLDGGAVKAAIADGKPREEARTLMVWVRNQNPRLRSLPLAADLRVDFFKSCDETPDRRAMLTQLAGNARLGSYFYSLTVRDGWVHAIKERQIIPAC